MFKCLFLALLLFGAAAAHAADLPPSWDARYYNPKPANDDFVLPMPCGGAMVFRRVETPASPGPLDDRAMILGEADPDTNYAEFVRPEHLIGGFGGDGKRFYFIGKYEVTVDQEKALDGGTCPTPSNSGRLPAVKLDWFDAVALVHRYNSWLYKNARNKLPEAGGARGFVRLPTETEWEYAARGGAAVSEADFRGRLFPMAEGVARYVWFQGSRSAAGQLQSVGLLKPNPLGLYDIIGNASEIVLEPYRLNKVGRLHGEAGGFIIKGGDFRTAEDRLRSSLRIELRPFNPETGEPTHLQTVGVRFAIGSIAITSLQETTALRAAFDRLSTGATNLPEDPQALLARAIKEALDPNLKRGLEAVANSLKQETRARTEADERAVHSAVSAGAVLVRSIRDLVHRAEAIAKFLDEAKRDQQRHLKGAEKNVAEFTSALGGVEEYQRNTLAVYALLVSQVGNDYQADTVDAQLKVVEEDFGGQHLATLQRFAEQFVDHTRHYRKDKKLDTTRWLREIAQ